MLRIEYHPIVLLTMNHTLINIQNHIVLKRLTSHNFHKKYMILISIQKYNKLCAHDAFLE